MNSGLLKKDGIKIALAGAWSPDSLLGDIERAFEKIGTVQYVGLPYGLTRPGYSPSVDVSEVDADLLLYVDEWASCLPRGLEHVRMPTAAFFTDVVHDLSHRQCLAPFFDHIFVAHADFIDKFGQHPSVHWLPYGVDSQVLDAPPAERDLDIAFVGTPQGARMATLEMLAASYKMNEFRRNYTFDEMTEIYRRAKIVFNMGTQKEVTMRIFEGPACGALLITESGVPGLQDLFVAGQEIVTFGDPNELVGIISVYLADETLRAKIAAAGHSACRTKHTWDARVGSIVRCIDSQPQRNAPIRRMAESERLSAYARAYSQLMAVDDLCRLVSESPVDSMPSIGTIAHVGHALMRRARRLGWRRLFSR